MWTERTERAEVSIFRSRHRGNGYGILGRTHIDDKCIEGSLRAHFGICLIGHNDEISAGQRQCSVRTAGKRRRPVDARKHLGLTGIPDVMNRETAVAPGAVATIARGDHVMQCYTTA